MKEFQVILRNEKRKQYIQIAFLFVLINFLAFVYLGFSASANNLIIRYFVQAGIILVCLFIDRIFMEFKGYEKRPYLIVAMFLSSWAWLKNDNWWAFGLCTILGFLFIATNRILHLKLSADHILYPSFPKRKINWESLDNVILKDGLLTIDQKNNKLIQQYLDETTSTVSEIEFNEFCRHQLNVAKTV